MFYLKFLKDKYKVSYTSGTPKGENHYRIHEELQTTLPKIHPPNTYKDYWAIFFFFWPMPWGDPVALNSLHTPSSDHAFNTRF